MYWSYIPVWSVASRRPGEHKIYGPHPREPHSSAHLTLQLITLRKQRDEVELKVEQRGLAHPAPICAHRRCRYEEVIFTGIFSQLALPTSIHRLTGVIDGLR
ncbi:hypothetical protein GKT88_07745 [Salmonella enterica]|nr:hypothetical protein [Salmonella enterica]